MAIHTHRTVTTTRDTWTIPAIGGHVHMADFFIALRAAEATYRHTHDMDLNEELFDDAIQVTGQGDGSVVISFESWSSE